MARKSPKQAPLRAWSPSLDVHVVPVDERMDRALRAHASTQAVAMGEVLRRCILLGAQAHLRRALEAPLGTPLANTVTSPVLRAARGAGLMAAHPDADHRPAAAEAAAATAVPVPHRPRSQSSRG